MGFLVVVGDVVVVVGFLVVVGVTVVVAEINTSIYIFSIIKYFPHN